MAAQFGRVRASPRMHRAEPYATLQFPPGGVERYPTVAFADLALGQGQGAVALIAEELRGDGLEHAGPGPHGHGTRQTAQADRAAAALIVEDPDGSQAEAAQKSPSRADADHPGAQHLRGDEVPQPAGPFDP